MDKFLPYGITLLAGGVLLINCLLEYFHALCWHRYVKSPAVHHWQSAGGELRAYDLGIYSCSKTCRKCGKRVKLDTCESLDQDERTDCSEFSTQVILPEQNREQSVERRIKHPRGKP